MIHNDLADNELHCTTKVGLWDLVAKKVKCVCGDQSYILCAVETLHCS